MARKNILGLVLFSTGFGMAQPALAQEGAHLRPDDQGIIFQIGREDKSRTEFKAGGWAGVDLFECTVGVDCLAANLPTRLVSEGAASFYDSTTVQVLVINFDLAEDTSDVVLSVARFGIETSVVRIDDGSRIVISEDMMDPPYQEDIWGRFHLPLGALSAGSHKIQISVEKDTAGTGRHSLDSLKLYARGIEQ